MFNIRLSNTKGWKKGPTIVLRRKIQIIFLTHKLLAFYEVRKPCIHRFRANCCVQLLLINIQISIFVHVFTQTLSLLQKAVAGFLK